MLHRNPSQLSVIGSALIKEVDATPKDVIKDHQCVSAVLKPLRTARAFLLLNTSLEIDKDFNGMLPSNLAQHPNIVLYIMAMQCRNEDDRVWAENVYKDVITPRSPRSSNSPVVHENFFTDQYEALGALETFIETLDLKLLEASLKTENPQAVPKTAESVLQDPDIAALVPSILQRNPSALKDLIATRLDNYDIFDTISAMRMQKLHSLAEKCVHEHLFMDLPVDLSCRIFELVENQKKAKLTKFMRFTTKENA